MGLKTITIKRYRTRKIVLSERQVSFNPYSFTTENLDKVTALIRSNLTYDLLSRAYKNRVGRHRFSGFCVPASEAIEMLFDDESLELWRGDHQGERHYFIKRQEQVIDATGDQYVDFPYHLAKKAQRYTFAQQYQTRSLNLAIRILRDDGVEVSDNLIIK